MDGIDAQRFDRIHAEDGQVRIRLIANNGAIIATGEPYASSANAERAITRITNLLCEELSIVEN